MTSQGLMHMLPLRVDVPGEDYHAGLIACQRACPVHTDARGYVRAIAEGRFDEAYLIARGPNPFASICGRICGAPCEAACRRGKVPRVDDDGRFVATDRPIAIRALKRFVCEIAGPEARPTEDVLNALRAYAPSVAADAEEMAALLRAGLNGRIVPASGDRVAIIGAGPAGLSAAHDLALLGCRPVVFESEPLAAGMLAVGVPAYRLPREVIAREVAVIEALGVEIRCGVTVGKDVIFADLRRDYAAVIVAVGAKASRARSAWPASAGPGSSGASICSAPSRSMRPSTSVVRWSFLAAATSRTMSRAPSCGKLRTTRRARRRAWPAPRACASSRSKGSRRCRPTPSRSSRVTKKASSG